MVSADENICHSRTLLCAALLPPAAQSLQRNHLLQVEADSRRLAAYVFYRGDGAVRGVARRLRRCTGCHLDGSRSQENQSVGWWWRGRGVVLGRTGGMHFLALLSKLHLGNRGHSAVWLAQSTIETLGSMPIGSDLGGVASLLAQGAERERIVALGQTNAKFVQHEWTVIEGWHSQLEGTV